MLILFGGSIAYGCDVVGKAISNNIAKNFMIVGGEDKLFPSNIIIVQDSTMQRRMDAGFRKYLQGTKVEIINFASSKVIVEVKNENLVIEPPNIWGMWDVDRYISMLMGEIPRLSDDANGYGPNGKNYIEHVDIPLNALRAFEELKVDYEDLIRVQILCMLQNNKTIRIESETIKPCFS